MKPYRFHDHVHGDIADSAEWYEHAEPGLGIEFVLAVETAIDAIREAPRAWPRWPGTPPDLGIHRFTLPRFPFLIGYLDDPEAVVILVVHHGKRRPLHWLRRLRGA